MVSDRKPGGYRNYIPAIGLTVVATLLAVALAWHRLETGRPKFTEDPHEEEIDPNYRPGGRSCDPSAIGPFPHGDPLVIA